MTGRTNYRTTDAWMTVGVTLLPPGWRNVWHYYDGIAETDSCPALLLQEHRETASSWDETLAPAGAPRTVKTYVHEPPFSTRLIFGMFGDQGSGELCSVSAYDIDGPMEQYIGTLEPGQEIPEWMHEHAHKKKEPAFAATLNRERSATPGTPPG